MGQQNDEGQRVATGTAGHVSRLSFALKIRGQDLFPTCSREFQPRGTPPCWEMFCSSVTTRGKRAGSCCHSDSENEVRNCPTVCRTAPSMHCLLKTPGVAPWEASGQPVMALVGSTLPVCCIKLESCKHVKRVMHALI